MFDNNAQKDALTHSIDGATTVAGVNQETAKATELNNAFKLFFAVVLA
jgi:hypothetical protein